VLDELDDDAIVAQQTALHSPQPRVQVSMESRSVVIADDAELTPASISSPHATRPINKRVGKGDPTVMIRDKRLAAELAALEYAPSPPPPAPRKRWTTTLVWVTAGLIAFGFGGVLALLMRDRGSETAQTPPPAPAEPKSVPVSEEPKLTQKIEPSEPAARENDDGQAVSASELPIEPAQSARATRSKGPAKPARPARTAAPKSDIPSGI
jgi:hypothetical protein